MKTLVERVIEDIKKNPHKKEQYKRILLEKGLINVVKTDKMERKHMTDKSIVILTEKV